jgi:hypothetical protein
MRGAILFCLALPALAGTVVSESHLVAANGRLAAGSLDIAPKVAFSAADGARVAVPSTIKLVNGAFSVTLEPGDTGTPANVHYVVTWRLDGARPHTEEWAIPTTAAVLHVADVLTPPAAPVAVLPSRIVPLDTDPGCVAAADWGKEWLDSGASTDVLKVCMMTSGTLGWVAK